MEAKAYTQVYHILQMLSEEERCKIPESLILGIKNKMDKSYEFNTDDLEAGMLLEDAEKMLSVIYTDYLASEEERKIITSKEMQILMQREKAKKEKYSSDVFKNKHFQNNSCNNNNKNV